jgi:sensitive to high expression protein 9
MGYLGYCCLYFSLCRSLFLFFSLFFGHAKSYVPSPTELKLKATRQAAKDAKGGYASAVVKRSESQREVNDLLQRKSNWQDGDVSRFTALVRLDHAFVQEEAEAKAAVDVLEETVDREFSELMRSILARYHEEQVWSDKIRSVSTYGSLAVLGLNVVVFVMAIVVVEPWKRKRLAVTFEKKVEEMSNLNRAAFTEGFTVLERQLEEQRSFVSVALQREEEASASAETVPEDGDGITEPQTTVLFRDAEVVMIAAASAFIAGGVGWLLGKLL